MSRGYAAIGLLAPKTEPNVGGVLRASMCYGVSLVAIAGQRYKRQSTDTLKASRHIPIIHVADLKDAVPFDCVPVAVELLPTGTPLPAYKHPERAFYVFGPEDGTLGKTTLSWCRDLIYIPISFSMNLAACVNVVLYDRLAKASLIQ